MGEKYRIVKARAEWLLYVIKSLRPEPQNIFLGLAIVFGFGFMVVTPPMQVPDETEHLYRAYQVSQFNLMADPVQTGYGGTLPVNLVDTSTELKRSVAGQPHKRFDISLLRRAWHTPLEPAKQKSVRFDNTAIYSPVPYLPQAFGIGVSRVLKLNPLIIIYVGRLANLLVWIALIYAAIRLTPIGKWAFTIVALNPMALFLAASLSSDAMIIGLVAVFVATVLRLRTIEALPDKRYVALLAISALMICLTKNMYVPLVLLALLIPSSVLKVYWKYGLVALALAVGVLWNLAVLAMARRIPSFIGLTANVDTEAQIENILHSPLQFLQVVGNAIGGQQSSAVVPSYSGVFGWLDTGSPMWISLLYLFTLLIALLYRSETKRVLASLNVKVRLFSGAIIAISTVALLSSLYVGYSGVGASLIEGIQGRYFIPLTFLAVIVAANSAIKVAMSHKATRTLVVSSMTVVLSGSIITLLMRYYS